MFRWRHAAVVLGVYILMGQCGGRGRDYEGYGRLAGKSEVIPSTERLSSKFHSFPQSFAGDRLFIFGTIFQLWALSFNTPASRKEKGLFVLKPSE